jgi:hypothetical protein
VSFLEPLYLLLAGAAAVPLLLHLLRRRISLRIEFPAARYILRAERENSRKLKLRNLLLMLLRVLAVLFIALAAARPVGRLIGSGHAPTAVAIVLDNSLSTSTIIDGAPLFRKLRAAALAAARHATPSDRVWLVTADGRVVGGSSSAVADAIQRLEPIAGAGDLPAATARAVGLVRGAGLTARRVAVATDGQATAWRRSTASPDVGISMYVPTGTPPLNHAVIAADARPSRWTPRGSVVARTLGADSTTYRIALSATPGAAARTLARGTAVANGEILVRAAPPERGWVAGAVELEPDELRGDDVRHFAVWIGAAPAISVDPALGTFARTAVDALIQSERLRAGNDAAMVSADALAKLPALIVAPSDPVRVGAANRALERAGVPWRFGAVRHETGTAREATTVTTKLVDGATVSTRFPLTAVGDPVADTLARVGAEPWIVAGDRYVIIASPLDPSATDFPVRAGFLPWLAEAASQRLAGDGGVVLAATPGARLRAPAGIQAVDDAAGQATAITSDEIVAPDRAGVYFMRRGGAKAGAVVVNGEPEESSLARLSSTVLRSRFDGRDVTMATDGEKWANDAYTGSSRRPLSTPILVLAAIVLVMEALVARGVLDRGSDSAVKAAA